MIVIHLGGGVDVPENVEETITLLVDEIEEHGYSNITLTEPERHREGRWALKLIRTGVDIRELVAALEYGMPEVWPYTKGQAYGLKEVYDNLTKARSMAMRAAYRGEIKHDTRELRKAWEDREGGE
jgi:hypothetical protein